MRVMGVTPMTKEISRKFSDTKYLTKPVTPEELGDAIDAFRCIEPPGWRDEPRASSVLDLRSKANPTYVTARPAPQTPTQQNPSYSRSSPAPFACWKCQSPDHRMSDCPKYRLQVMREEDVPEDEVMAVEDPRSFWKDKAKERPPCFGCGQLGHWKNECPNLKPRQPYRQEGTPASQPQRPPQTVSRPPVQPPNEKDQVHYADVHDPSEEFPVRDEGN
jgi:hypothetical protein